jgi:hypothetical protein
MQLSLLADPGLDVGHPAGRSRTQGLVEVTKDDSPGPAPDRPERIPGMRAVDRPMRLIIRIHGDGTGATAIIGTRGTW